MKASLTPIGLAAIALLLASAARGDNTDVRIDVVVNLTAAGEKVPPPTPGKPAYYYPVPIGYEAEGAIFTRYQKPPGSPLATEHQIAVALAKQGYLLVPPGAHPAMFLFLSWGYVAPQHVNGVFVNEMQMMTYTMGEVFSARGNENYSFVRNHPNARVQNALDDARTARWYFRVTAIDYDDWQNHHKSTPLWHAYVTTALWGHNLGEVLPQMIADGTPLFGRESHGPQFTEEEIIPVGHSTVGTPVVKGP